MKKILRIVGLFANMIPKACELMLKAAKKVLEIINTVVKPITDMTPTNKDNELQAKISAAIEESIVNIETKIIPMVGKMESFINKYLG